MKTRVATAALIGSVTACYCLFVTGYVAFLSDQFQYLLLPFRSIVPDLAAGDWFVWDTDHYHFVFSYMIRGLESVPGDTLPGAMFLVWFTTTAFYLYGLYRLVRALGGGAPHFVLMVLFHALYLSIGVGQSDTIGDMLLPTHLAFAAMTHAFASLVGGRPAQAALFLGFAALFHVAFAVLGAPIIFGHYLLERRSDWLRGSIRMAFAFVLPALPTLIPVVQSFLTTFGDAGGAHGLELAFMIRSPHHYDPASFSLGVTVLLVAPIVLGLFSSWNSPDESVQRASRIQWLILALLGATLLAFFAGGPQIITRFWPWRFSPFLLVISYALLAREFLNAVSARRALVLSAPLLGLVVLRHASNAELVRGIIAGGVLAFAGFALVRLWQRESQSRWKPVHAASVCFLALVLTSGNAATGYFPRSRPIELSYEDAMLSWIREETQPGDVFLVPPDMDGVRLLGQRAIVANFKCVPLGNGRHMEEWARRMAHVTGCEDIAAFPERGFLLRDRLTDLYLERDVSGVTDTMATYSARYFVTYDEHQDLGQFTDQGMKLCYSDGRRFIFKLKGPSDPRS